MRYDPRQLAELAADAWSLLAVRKPGAPKIRFDGARRVRRPRAAAQRVRARDRQRRHAVPASIRSWPSSPSAASTSASWCIRSFTVERDQAGRSPPSGARKPAAGALRESFIHIHVERIDEEARRAEIVEAHRAGARRRPRLRCRTGGRCSRASARSSPSSRPIRRRCRSTRSPRPSQFLRMARRQQFHLSRHAQLRLTAGEDELEPVFESGLGILRARDMRVVQRWNQAARRHAGDPRAPARADAAHRHQGRRRARACTAASTWTMSASSASIARRQARRRVAHRRPVHLDRLYALDARRSPICAARSTPCSSAPASTRTAIPARRWSTCWRTIRATSCSRSTRTRSITSRWRSCSSTSGRACACLPRRDRFDRFVSVLVYVPRERYDSEVRKAIGDYLADVYNGRVTAFYPFFPEGPLVRVHFIIALSPGDAPNPDRASLERAVEAIVRTWIDDARRGARPRLRSGAGARAARALPPRLLRRLSRGLFAGRSRSATSASSRGSRPSARSASTSTVAPPMQANARRAEGLELRTGRSRSPSACRCWRTWASRSSTSAPIGSLATPPTGSTCGCTTCCSSAPTVAPVDLDAAKRGLEALFLVVMRGGAENDGYNALVLAAGTDVARRGADPHHLALPAPDPRALFAGLHVGDAGQARADRRRHRAPVPRALRSASRCFGRAAARRRNRRRRRDRSRAAGGREPRRGPHPAPLRQRGAGGDPHQFLSDRRRRDGRSSSSPSSSRAASSTACRCRARSTRSSSIRRGSRACICASARSRAAASAGRTGRRISAPRCSAWSRRSRSRTPSSCRSAPRAASCRSSLPADGAREAVQAEGTAAYKLFISHACSTSPTISMPTRVVPPDNVVRHDDDDPYLVVAADKGTATFSDIANAHLAGARLLARRRLRLRRLGRLRPQEDGHHRARRLGIGQAPFPRDGRRHRRDAVHRGRRRRHVGRRVRQRHAAVERTIKLVAAFDHRDIFIDPAPDPEKSFAERQRLFDLPRSSWQDYDHALDLQGRRRVFARAEGDRALARGARGSGLRRGQGDARTR